MPVGGRLIYFYRRWRELTSDLFLLSAVRGYEIEFDHSKGVPSRNKPLYGYKKSPSEMNQITKEILALQAKNVIEPCSFEEGEFLSNIFTRPKKDGGTRMILDLSELNQSLNVQHFKMDNIHTAKHLITPHCYLASIDLQDAYYSIPVDPHSRKYLRFMWQGERWQFAALPNGLSTAPRLFTKLLKPVFAELRQAGHTVIGYLDDTIIIGETKEKLKESVSATTKILSELGFLIHTKKSVLIPTRELVFLGFLLNTESMTVRLPQAKAQEVKDICCELMGTFLPSIRMVAQVIGKVIATFPAVEYGPLYYRSMERDKIAALRQNRGHFDRKMKLSLEAKEELKWWMNNVSMASSPIVRKKPDLELHTDASGLGWGATDLQKQTGGRWNEFEAERARNNEINFLETLAAGLGIKSFCMNKRNVHVMVRIDNTTAVAYLNHMGGCKSAMCDKMTREIWQWCISRNIWLTAAHVPGRLNSIADERSRKFNDRTEWKLNRQAFDRIVSHFGVPEIDLFASRLNAQVEKYVTWHPDPGAFAVDAFTLDWKPFAFYAFPPFCMIPKCLQKIREDKARGLLLVPNWPTQAWFPQLVSMMEGEPLFIQRQEDLLLLPVLNTTHPLNANIDLLCCRLCGNTLRIGD